MSKENEAFAREANPDSNSAPAGPTIHGPTYNTVTPEVPQCGVPPVTAAGNAYLAPSAYGSPAVFRQKSVIETYLLWLVLGLVGGHHFYLGRPGFGVLYFFTFGLLGCGWVIDMFRIPFLVIRANKQLADRSSVDEKTIADAYTLWMPFGLLGFHHFYLNRPGWGTVYFFTMGFFGIGWLIDLFRIPSLVKAANGQTIDKREKQVCTAYAIGMMPSGLLGGHHFYLNRHEFGLLYFFTLGILGVGWIVDWFRIPLLVKRANKHIAYGNSGKRYLDDAYLLWFPLGLIGAHHFYLRRYVWGVLYFCTFGLLGVGWLLDGCRMHCLVKEANKLNAERRRLPASVGGQNGVVITTPAMASPPPAGYGAAVAYPTQQPGAHPQPQGTCPQQQGAYPQQQGAYPQQQGAFPQPAGVYLSQQPPLYQPQPVPSYMEQPPPYTTAVNPSVAESKK